ncbi:hypothetical protein O9929_27710 [Vibrio lentus]|nr:hypothetical protein [Vibrio lentus]
MWVSCTNSFAVRRCSLKLEIVLDVTMFLSFLIGMIDILLVLAAVFSALTLRHLKWFARSVSSQ